LPVNIAAKVAFTPDAYQISDMKRKTQKKYLLENNLHQPRGSDGADSYNDRTREKERWIAQPIKPSEDQLIMCPFTKICISRIQSYWTLLSISNVK
jgi:hypothetical protein